MQARMLREVLSLTGVLSLLLGSGAAQSFNFDPIDGPCSDCSGGIALSTTAYGINPAGDIVGNYNDAAGNEHGFLLDHGSYTTLDMPDARGTGTGTWAIGINFRKRTCFG